MNKRIYAFILALILMVTSLPGITALASREITVYLTVSHCGEIAEDKNGNSIALSPITLSGQESYTLDDLFLRAHEEFYPDGESGYASSEGGYGLAVNKFWGNDSGLFGYQVNYTSDIVMGPTHILSNGDHIDAYILKNSYPDTELYTAFSKSNLSICPEKAFEVTLNEFSYDENFNLVSSPCANAVITLNGSETEITTDTDGKAVLTLDEEGTFIISAKKTKTVNDQTVTAITAPLCLVTAVYPNAQITTPATSQLYVGFKGGAHFVDFTEIEPLFVNCENDANTYYFYLTEDSTYNYRLTGTNHVTYAGTFKHTDDFNKVFTDEILSGGEKKDTDRNLSSNNGYNVADIYLNINPKGHLKLAGAGETYQIVALRNWEAVNSTSANYFIEPDYHYYVTDENGTPSDNVITVDKNGLITAKNDGVAIVFVTYDAINIDFGAGKQFFGAIWPENTGVFVVSVGNSESDIIPDMTINKELNDPLLKLSGENIDAEHDVIYFTGNSGSYSFTPKTPDCDVFVFNPSISDTLSFNGFTKIEQNEDLSFQIPLTNGRNIIKISKDGQSEYQVITAKKVEITVNDGNAVYPGDNLSIAFDTLYHPANKLAGVYNMSALAVYTDVDGYENKIIGSLPSQYNFASNEDTQKVANILKEVNQWGAIYYEKDTDLIIPSDYAYDMFTLSGGTLYASGWGDSFGNHRGITFTDGKAPNLSADAKKAFMGSLPDIKIPVTLTDAKINSLRVDTSLVKTEYYDGETFCTDNLTVVANFADGKSQIATVYETTPSVLSEDTEAVIITYKGKTTSIPVTVSPAIVTDISVTVPPVTTVYEEGSLFDPTGMVVTLTYSNGQKKVTNNYTYSPARELTKEDTQIKVTYCGDDAELSDFVAITVTEKDSSGAAPSRNIKVKVSVYGDDKHGADGKKHTMADNNLKVWVPKTSVTLPKGSLVIDAITKLLSSNGIPYSNPTGDYIENVKGLAEFDNGISSGWMYTLNGRYPSRGISEQTVKNGDTIVFHYTDDYSKERSQVSGGGTVVQGGSSLSSKEDTASPVSPAPSSPVFLSDTFSDVKSSDWYYEAVKYVYENSLMQGTGKNFEPEVEMTRAMLVTVLYRAMAPQKTPSKSSFSDIPDGMWYSDAVNWAAENGIVSGVSETRFEPDAPITREQLAIIMHRFSSEAISDTSSLEDFNDAADVSHWAIDAVNWAISSGLLTGTGNSELTPKGICTRGQIATVLMRYFTK